MTNVTIAPYPNSIYVRGPSETDYKRLIANMAKLIEEDRFDANRMKSDIKVITETMKTQYPEEYNRYNEQFKRTNKYELVDTWGYIKIEFSNKFSNINIEFSNHYYHINVEFKHEFKTVESAVESLKYYSRRGILRKCWNIYGYNGETKTVLFKDKLYYGRYIDANEQAKRKKLRDTGYTMELFKNYEKIECGEEGGWKVVYTKQPNGLINMESKLQDALCDNGSYFYYIEYMNIMYEITK
jgi:hypothetical protein